MALPPVLGNKLFFPPVRQNLVSRPRLVEKVISGLQLPLLLISAPAGYGKTTLMGEWRAGMGSHYPVAWLSLDRDDSDLDCFLIYLIAALATLKQGFGKTALALSQSSPPPPARFILTSLINELGEFDQPFALVLDDYHVIVDPSIHDAVSYLLNHLPSQMHLVILTRADPPLPLSRLRAANRLAEIRATDLCFTVEEASAFLDQVMGLELSMDQVEDLEQRTEGWAAGLQLAALSLQGRQDVQSFVSAFTGSQRYIVDYLVEEVLSRQPQDVREFLLKTSILDRLTAPLCDALTERSDSQSVLEHLERENLFLIPLDEERSWYRYHHLFADVLRDRLKQANPQSLIELYRRAGAWCEQNQVIDQAVEHAFAIKDYDRVVQLFRKYFYLRLAGRRNTRAWRWLESLPDEIIRADPWLCTVYAWWVWSRGDKEATEIYLEYAQQALARWLSAGLMPQGDREYDALPSEIAVFQGLVNIYKGNLDRAIELTNQALAIVPETEYTVRGIAYLNLCLVYREQGEVEKAIEACTQAIPATKAGEVSGPVIDAYHNLGLMFALQGQLGRAAEVYREALQYAEDKWQSEPAKCSLFFIHLAEISYAWNDLDEAERLAGRALDICQPAFWQVMVTGRLFLSLLQRARGNLPVALQLLGEAETILQGFTGTFLHSDLGAYLAMVKARLGKLDQAGQWIRTVSFDPQEPLGYSRLFQANHMAHVLYDLGKDDELLDLLSCIEPAIVAQGYRYWQIQDLVMQAVAWHRKADSARAFHYLEKALSLAQSEGYLRAFLDEGQPMRLLLTSFKAQLEKDYPPSQGESSQRLKAYTTRLLLAFPEAGLTASKSAHQDRGSMLVEPLSERELEVLRLAAEGKTNQEIADALVIARGTVKKHLNNIFGKLGAQNRTQCVARARELSLLK